MPEAKKRVTDSMLELKKVSHEKIQQLERDINLAIDAYDRQAQINSVLKKVAEISADDVKVISSYLDREPAAAQRKARALASRAQLLDRLWDKMRMAEEVWGMGCDRIAPRRRG